MKFCAKEKQNKETKLTDEELIGKIKTGDEVAENELFSRYKDLVVKISRSFFIVGGDLEDLIQEGMIGLYKAIRSYSPQKDASFKTFATVCIKHQIQSAIKKANAGKNKPLSSAVSFQEFTAENSNDFLPIELILSTSPDETIINKENFEHLKTLIKKTLTQTELKVLVAYLQGFSYKEIAQTLSITEKAIDNSLTRIKTKLRTNLKKD